MLRKLNAYREILNENQAIIANRDTGAWIKISRECRNIICDACCQSMSRDELLSQLADDEDREYIKTLIFKMKELEVISEAEEKNHDLDVIYLLVTNRCNLKCTHCCADAVDKSSEVFKQEMDIDELKSAIDKIINANPNGIAITGGEPMVRKDFFEFLGYLRKNYRGKIALATNATLITKENASLLVKLIDKFDISVDGIDEDTCSKVRGKGVFGKVINAIDVLQKNGATEISLSMTFGTSNYHLRQAFLKLNEKLGTIPIVRIFMPKGRGEKSQKNFNLNIENNPKTEFTQEEIKEARKSLRIITCGAGIGEFVINYDGWIYPCPNMITDKYRLIHIREINDLKNMADALSSKKEVALNNLMKIQPENFEACKGCKVNLFCWSCLEDLEIKSKDSRGFQKRCEIQKKILYPLLWN